MAEGEGGEGEKAVVMRGRKRTEDVLIGDGSERSFEDLLLSREVREGLREGGYERPSPVQLHAIPLGLFGLDLLAQAKSGPPSPSLFCSLSLSSLFLGSNPPLQSI